MAFHSWRDADATITRVLVKDRARTLKSTFAADLPLFCHWVVNAKIAENRRYYSPNAKDNFEFELKICGWRGDAVLDLRRKR
jgi:hypothetical protein